MFNWHQTPLINCIAVIQPLIYKKDFYPKICNLKTSSKRVATLLMRAFTFYRYLISISHFKKSLGSIFKIRTRGRPAPAHVVFKCCNNLWWATKCPLPTRGARWARTIVWNRNRIMERSCFVSQLSLRRSIIRGWTKGLL